MYLVSVRLTVGKVTLRDVISTSGALWVLRQTE